MGQNKQLAAGFFDVPKGHLATVVTHLEMRQPPAGVALNDRTGLHLDRLNAPGAAPDTDAYRALFRRVGEDWLWFSRLRLHDEALVALLSDTRIEAFAACDAGHPVGLLELDFRAAPVVELAFFGLVPERLGQGLGTWLMAEALGRAWDPARPTPTRTLTVHTCTLDSPAALRFYRASGFVPVRQEVEIAPDPRLDGTMPRTAGPAIPILP